MERDRLARVVREPDKVGRTDIVGLKAMADRYPWFTGAHLLLALGEHANGDVLYDDTLTRTAAHLPSREALFDLTEAAMPPAAQAMAPAPASVGPTSILTNEAMAPAPAILVEPPPPPAVTAPPAPALAEAEHVAPPPPPLTEEAPTDGPSNTEDVLDRQILEAALSSAYDLTWHERVVQEAPVEELSPQTTEVPPTAEVVSTEPEPPPVIPGPIPIATPPALQPVPPPAVGRGSRLRFTDWLSTGSGAADPAPPVATPPAPSAPPSVAEVPRAVAQPPTSPVPSPDPKALIDRFIQKDTPPPPTKTAFYTPQQAAKRSLDDTAGLVTETLARIYEKQGNLAKAIDAYGRLALKHPEKSAYFAALRKKLEEQLNK